MRPAVIALLAHAVLLALADWTLDPPAPTAELSVDLELVDEPAPMPSPPATPPLQATLPVPVPVPVPAPVPVRVPAPVPAHRLPRPTSPAASELTTLPVPVPPSAPGALSMRAAIDIHRPDEPALPAPPSPLLDLRLRRDFLASATAPAPVDARDPLGPLPPVHIPGEHPPPDDSELRPAGGGTFSKDDLTFRGKVDRYGRVDISDKPSITVKFLPGISLKSIGDGLDRWYREGERPCADHGITTFEEADQPDCGGNIVSIPLIEIGFDVTDAIVRAIGDDPYMARKLTFLDRTRDQRAAMAVRAHDEDLADSLAGFGTFLVKLWKHTAWTPLERRAILFELWDECAEPPDEDATAAVDPLAAAGETARRQIEKLIRLRLPAGDASAYTDAELATLNQRRQSRQRFAPYRLSAASDKPDESATPDEPPRANGR